MRFNYSVSVLFILVAAVKVSASWQAEIKGEGVDRLWSPEPFT